MDARNNRPRGHTACGAHVTRNYLDDKSRLPVAARHFCASRQRASRGEALQKQKKSRAMRLRPLEDNLPERPPRPINREQGQRKLQFNPSYLLRAKGGLYDAKKFLAKIH
jgi:hypothetical protein